MGRLTTLVLLLAAGCDGAELERVRAERDALQGRVAELEREVTSLKKTSERAEKAPPKRAAAPDPAVVAEAREALGLAEGQKLKATLVTTQGDINCELLPDMAPKTVQNFVGLAEGTKPWTDPKTGEKKDTPLYDGTVFHRVIRGFMIQGGDPLGNGRGGPGYRFEDEVWPSLRFDKPGLLAMANSGPNTNGSQFFITDSSSTPRHLDMRHTIFGRCELAVVDKIASVPVGGAQGSRPLEDVVITSIKINRI